MSRPAGPAQLAGAEAELPGEVAPERGGRGRGRRRARGKGRGEVEGGREEEGGVVESERVRKGGREEGGGGREEKRGEGRV